MKRKIGLTGGIASGKSSVAEMLAGLLQCQHIDADDICRRLLEPQAEGWQKFTRKFGAEYLLESGAINRSLLRRELFASEAFRREIDSIMHPLAKKAVVTRLEAVAASGPGSRVLVEVPLLFEVGWEELFDAVIVVYADHETCRVRLMKRDGVDRETAEQELLSQRPLSEKVLKADYVIDNSGTPSETRTQVEALAELLKNSRNGVEKKLDSQKGDK